MTQTAQLDLFAAAPPPARRAAKPDTALLLAMPHDHEQLSRCAHFHNQRQGAPFDSFEKRAEQ